MILLAINDSIILVYLSKCGKYFVCAGACGTTTVYKNNDNRWSLLKTIEKQNSAPTAIAMHNKTNRLVLAFADYKVRKFTEGKTLVL